MAASEEGRNGIRHLATPRHDQQDLWDVIKNVNGCKLVHEDPWLYRYDDVFLEDSTMVARSRGESRAAWLLKILFTLSFFNLNGDRMNGPRNRVELGPTLRYWLGNPLDSRRSSTTSRLFGMAALVLITCCALLVLVNCYLLFKHDSMIVEMRPTLDARASNINETLTRVKLEVDQMGHKVVMCALREHIIYGGGFKMDKFVELNECMDLTGGSSRAQLGALFLLIFIIISGAMVFFCLPLVFVLKKGHRVRLDSVACIVDAPLERRRLLGELEQVIWEIMAAFDQACRENKRLVQRDNRSFEQAVQLNHMARRLSEWKTKAKRKEGAKRFLSTLDRPLNEDNSSSLMSHIDKIRFMGTLNEIRNEHLVRPVVICSKWHEDMQRYTSFLVILFLAISSGFPQVNIASTHLLELYLHTLERHKQSKCEQWHPNGTIFKPTFQLVRLDQPQRQPLFFSQAERDAYEAYDGNDTSSLLYLMFFYETRHLFNINMVIYYLGLGVVIEFLSICSVVWTTTFMISSMDKIAWLVQIRCQIESCSRRIRSRLTRSSNGNERDGRCIAANESAEVELIQKQLTIAYINYELFRRQYKPFRRLTNFLVILVITYSAGSSIALYLVASRESSFKFGSMFISACVLGTLNVYLVVASYASKLVEHLMLDLIRLFALLNNYPKLLVGPTMDLWRRQLITKHEVHLFGTTKFLTLVISYQKILSFNVQLIGLWLLMLRFFNKNTAG